MSRRGRKHNPDAKRHKTTRAERSPIDVGTPELRMQRVRVHGMPDINMDHPIDGLAAKGLLCVRDEGEQSGDWLARNIVARDIAARFASLHRAIHGRSQPKALDPNARGRGMTQESDRDIAMEREYRAMREALWGRGRRIFDAVMNRAVYCRALPPLETHHWRREVLDIQAGISALLNVRPANMQRAA